jgi:hypothetical protein
VTITDPRRVTGAGGHSSPRELMQAAWTLGLIEERAHQRRMTAYPCCQFRSPPPTGSATRWRRGFVRNVRRGLLMSPSAASLMVGMGERLTDEFADVVVGQRVEDERPFPPVRDQTCQAQLGQVLTHGGRGSARQVREAGDGRLALHERPQDVQPGGIGQHAQRVGSPADVDRLGHVETLDVMVHGPYGTGPIDWVAIFAFVQVMSYG